MRLDDYQREAVEFLQADPFRLLADAPGVGKTAPTICASQELGGPVLVTAPAYLLPNWRREIGLWFPSATVDIANGNGSDSRRSVLVADTDFVLSSYNNWSARTKVGESDDGTPQYEYTYPELCEREWGVLVYDEGHRLRGRNSHCTRQVLSLRRAKSCNRKTPIWSLTGTPIVNNPGDLFPLLQLWRPREYRSYWKFVNKWCVVTETPWGKRVGQLRPGLEQEFQELLGQFTLRRTVKDVPKLASLEEVHEHYFVDMPLSVRRAIAKARKEYVLEHDDLESTEFVSGGGALFTRLRQMATDPPTKSKPKIDLVVDFLEDHPGSVVLYTWYKDSAAAVAARLNEKTKRQVYVVTGDTPAHLRGEVVDQWKTHPDALLVATISSLKEGISLVNASTVVFLEHSMLPADQEQCVARLKRRGQTRVVNVYHVWANSTPDIAIKKAVVDREDGLSRALTSWLKSDDAS